MIIPPDPEKDPRLFDESASASTPSLLPPPTETDVGDFEGAGNVNAAFGYPYTSNTRQANGGQDPFSDDLAIGGGGQGGGEGYADEVLPPYSRRRSRDMRNAPPIPVSDGAVPEMRERERYPRTRSPLTTNSHIIVPINTSNLTYGGLGGSGAEMIAPSPMSAGLDTPTTPSARVSESATPGSSTAYLAGSTLVPSVSGHGYGPGRTYMGASPSPAGRGPVAGAQNSKTPGKGKGTTKAGGLLRKFRLLPTSHPVDSTGSSSNAGPGPSTAEHRSSRILRGSSSNPQFAPIPVPLPSTSTLPVPASFSESEKPSAPSQPAVWWTKYKRHIIAVLLLLLIIVGALIGLVVGFRQKNMTEEAEAARARAFAQANGPAWHDLDPGDGQRGLVWADGSMNLTWVDARDAPPASDGNLTSCPPLVPFNGSNFSTLYTPYPGNSEWVSTFLLPLKYFNSSSNTTAYLGTTGDLPVANASHASPLSDAGAASASSGSGSGSRSGSGGGGGGGNGSNPSPSASAGAGTGGSVPYNAPSADSPYPADSTNSTSSASSSDTAQGQGHGQGQGLLRAYGRYDEIPIFARGVASTGTIEIIGADADPDVINGGVEGMVRIDVVMQYGGFQDVGSKVRVCEVVRGDGSIGVGVYTPTQTDGKLTNPYILDPTVLPSFHIIIRFPPSAVWERAPSLLNNPTQGQDVPPPLRFRSINMHVDSMALRVGDLQGLADFGRFSYDAGRGGVAVQYLAAKQVWIATSENSVRGTFNVSESLYVNATDSSIIADVILHDPSMYSNTSITPTTWMSKRDPYDGYDGAEGSWDQSAGGANENGTDNWRASMSSADWTPSTSSPADWGASTTPAYGSQPSRPSASSGHCLSCSQSQLQLHSQSQSKSQTDTADRLLSTITNATISNTVNTTIYTTDGLVSVSYLAHPPRTALVSWIATNQGDMDISYHPNFVGPFAIRNAWGAVRLPPPRRRVWDDPLGLGRMRVVVEGVISVSNSTTPPVAALVGNASSNRNGTGTDSDSDGSGSDSSTASSIPDDPRARAAIDDYMFTRAGLNETQLSQSGTTVTGAAYWQAPGVNGTMSPKQVQSSSNRRGTAVVLGGWGDVTVGFDGR